MTTTAEKLSALEAVHAKATKGPWDRAEEVATQLPLLDVTPNRTRLSIWKERHGVQTDPILHPHPCDEDRWRAFQDYYADDIGHGVTEEDACFALAEKLRLPWLESVNL